MLKKTLPLLLGVLILLGFLAGCKPKEPVTPEEPVDTTAAMAEAPMCQSCAMPMARPEDFGTEADGSASKDYCTHCYQNGEFTNPDATMEGMVEFLAPNWGEWMEKPDMTLDEAKVEVRELLSGLKRWKEA